MATVTYTQDFSVSELNQFIDELENIRSAYQGAQETCEVASAILMWFGVVFGAPDFLVVPGELLTTVFSHYLATVEDTITTAISQLEYWKDFLQDNSSRYNLVRMRVTCEQERLNEVTYLIPVKFETLAVHSINPPGWVTV